MEESNFVIWPKEKNLANTIYRKAEFFKTWEEAKAKYMKMHKLGYAVDFMIGNKIDYELAIKKQY